MTPTTESIAEMPVTFDEISTETVSEDDFIITDTTPVVDEEEDEQTKELQTDLLFDLPLNSFNEEKKQEEIKFSLEEEKAVNKNSIEVIEEKEIKSSTETRYVLQDFDAQPTIGKSSHITEKKEAVEEEEIKFELKTAKPVEDVNAIETSSEEVSPLDLTISELQERAAERRRKMKGFNYKFNDQMSKNVDEIEKQPAYKRQGLDLNVDTSISKSKTAIKKDDNDLGFKSNNSFLHDNVD